MTDEVEKELSALRQATDRVSASQALKSELLLAGARMGVAAGTASSLSLKLVLALVTAAGAGGLAVWGLTHEPPAPPPQTPAVSVSITVEREKPSPTAAGPAPVARSAPLLDTPPAVPVVLPPSPTNVAPAPAGPAPIVEGPIEGRCFGRTARPRYDKHALKAEHELRDLLAELSGVPQ
jgi:hypothetical protein